MGWRGKVTRELIGALRMLEKHSRIPHLHIAANDAEMACRKAKFGLPQRLIHDIIFGVFDDAALIRVFS
jgi:hypothetical protein